MESYDLDSEKIIDWAISYAEYEELEKTAKALYGIYVQHRKNTRPEEHKKNRKMRRKLTHTGEFRHPKTKSGYN